MQALVIINGTKVHVDQELDRIIGARLEFKDGSWCDTEQLSVSISQACKIRFETGERYTDYPTLNRRVFHFADIITIDNVDAQLVILPTQSRGNVQCEAFGSSEFIESLSVQQDLVSGALLVSTGDYRGEILVLRVPNQALINIDKLRRTIIIQDVNVEIEFDQ